MDGWRYSALAPALIGEAYCDETTLVIDSCAYPVLLIETKTSTQLHFP